MLLHALQRCNGACGNNVRVMLHIDVFVLQCDFPSAAFLTLHLKLYVARNMLFSVIAANEKNASVLNCAPGELIRCCVALNVHMSKTLSKYLCSRNVFLVCCPVLHKIVCCKGMNPLLRLVEKDANDQIHIV